MTNQDLFDELHTILVKRLEADADSSYTAALYQKGLDAILKKIVEETTETVIAAKEGVAKNIIYEIADLWFHTMVLLVQQGLNPQMVIDELTRRIGTSGLVEKAARKSKT